MPHACTVERFHTNDKDLRRGHADGGLYRKQLYGEQMAKEYRIPVIRLIDGSSGGGSVTTILSKIQHSKVLPPWFYTSIILLIENGASPMPHQMNFPGRDFSDWGPGGE